MAHNEQSTLKSTSKAELLLLEGGNHSESQETAFSSELYFSVRIFRALLDDLKNLTDLLKVQSDIESQNLYRRGIRLLAIGINLAKCNLFIKNNEMGRCPTTEVYKFLEELVIYFKDTDDNETSDFLDYLLSNEVISEIVTTLMVRPGRELSASALAIQFGLIDEAEGKELLESLGQNLAALPRLVNSALHDIDEIKGKLQYSGDIKSILQLT